MVPTGNVLILTISLCAFVSAQSNNTNATAIQNCYAAGTACSNGLSNALYCQGAADDQSCNCGVVNKYAADCLNCLKNVDPTVVQEFESNLQLCNGINGTNNGPFPSSNSSLGTSAPSPTSVHQSGAENLPRAFGILAGVAFVVVIIGNL